MDLELNFEGQKIVGKGTDELSGAFTIHGKFTGS